MIRSFLKTTLSNPVLVNVLMVMILATGYISWTIMVRERMPRFSLDRITVSVAYPGADPEEVEEGICLKLEEALEGIEGVKEVTSTASTGMGRALIECEDDADVSEVKDEVTNKVDSINTFPKDAERPIINEEKITNDVLSIAVWGDLPEYQLKETAREIQEELLSIKGISQVSISGTRDYEIAIEISEEKLRKFNLSFADLAKAVSSNTVNLHGGTIRTKNEEFRIKTNGRRYLADEYDRIPVITRADGTVIYLGDISEIRDSYDEDVETKAFFNGSPSVSVDVFKTESEDALKISSAVAKYVEEKQKKIPPTLHLTVWKDSSKFVLSRLDLLIRNGRFGLILVFFSLWLFLDLRLSFWITMGIPLSVAGALSVMYACGETLNMLSLFGLIMVLGLIVDDAIVVGESIYHKRSSGLESGHAAFEGVSDVSWPVIASVVTTIIAFIPLFFISGIMGKFIGHIPLPVIAALSFSLFESLFMLPVHLRNLPAVASASRRSWRFAKYAEYVREYTRGRLESFISRVYGPFVRRTLRWRYFVLCSAISLVIFTVALVKGGVIKFVFFPESDNDFLRAKVEISPGTPSSETSRVMERLLDAWKKVESETKVPKGETLTKAVFTLTGGNIGGVSGGNNVLEVSIEMLASEIRNIHYKDLLQKWQDRLGKIPEAVATSFGTFQRGPGGNPIEVRLYGNDQETLVDAASDLLAELDAFKGVFDSQMDYRPGLREFRISLKPEAEAMGLSINDIATSLNSAFYGAESLRIQRGRDEVKVKIKFPEKDGRDSISYFEKMRLKNLKGSRIPLLSVADVKLVEGESRINREKRKRLVKVTADVNRRLANAEEIMAKLESRTLPDLSKKFSGVSWSTEGETQERRESISGLLLVFLVAMFGIYLIISAVFKSYVQPVLIMITIPMGIIGASLAHIVLGLPITITMMSMFGMVALSGIVVNDAIVLIDCVNEHIASGEGVTDALCKAGSRRFRAIFLTTLTTFVGLAPMILERSMQARYLVPMAVSIAFGVAFATLLTLLLIPCMFLILNDLRRLSAYIASGAKIWPDMDSVEPAGKKKTDALSAEEVPV